MKQWWVCDYMQVPFATGRLFSFDWWRVMKAIRCMSRLPAVTITFFGGREAYEEGKYTQWARELARACVAHDMAVMTGGGPGIMEAANDSALHAASGRPSGIIWSLGVRVDGVDEEFKSKQVPCVTLPHFFMRKWLMISYAQGIVVFPGGIGTLDELFEVLNLIKTGKMAKVPVILMGINYWHFLLDWYEHAVDFALIKAEYRHMFKITDDVSEVIALLKADIPS